MATAIPNGEEMQGIGSEIQSLCHEMLALLWAMEESTDQTGVPNDVTSRAISYRRTGDRIALEINKLGGRIESTGMAMSRAENGGDA